MEQQAILAIAIFLVTYACIVSEKIHRTIIAMIGGIAVVVLGIVDQERAIHHIDFNTLGLLVGMMILVAITAETGLFRFIAIWTAKKVKGEPLRILLAFGFITAVSSAFLDNVTTVLLMVPMTFSMSRLLRVPVLPFLITEILASNIGGTATMIGDPPNIMIGSANKELTFMAFIHNLALINLLILAATLAILYALYRKALRATAEAKAEIMELDERKEITDRKLLVKCFIALGVTIGGLFLHQFVHVETAAVALTGAFLLLMMTGERYLETALHKVEWMTLFFFIGLFVLVSGLVETGVIEKLAQQAMALTGGDLTATSILILWMSAILSAFVDNIPFVATMIPMIQEMGSMGIANLEPLWWSLALGACLGGNGTLVGASANLVVAGLAANEGQKISFLKYLMIGFPLMLLSIVIATIYVYLRYLI